jgi:hypothetical protein
MKKKFSLEKLPNASYIPNYIKDPKKLFEQVKIKNPHNSVPKKLKKTKINFKLQEHQDLSWQAFI